MKKSLLLVFACTFILTASPLALACKCAPPPPPKKALEQSAAVFSGKITELKIVGDQKVVTFAVDRVWKGKVGATVFVTTHVHGATCGYGFTTKGDGTYLVYCHRENEKGELSTNLCTRTKPLSGAEADIKELGEGGKPKKAAKAGE